MQALLLSLDEQRGGAGGSSGSGDANETPHEAGPSGDAYGGAASVEEGDTVSEATDAPDAELLAHAARLAVCTAAPPPPQLSSTGTQCEAPGAGSGSGGSEPPAGPGTGSSTTVAYVHAVPPARGGAGNGAMPIADPACSGQGDVNWSVALPARSIGSAALADALADADAWTPPAAGAASLHSMTASGQPNDPTPTAGVGSTALVQALAAANGWDAASQLESASEHAVQAAAKQPAPFVGMVTVHTAAHIQPASSLPGLMPAAQPEDATAAGAGRSSSTQNSAGSDSPKSDDGSNDVLSSGVAALGEAGGAALLVQPDGSSMLVLLTNSAAAAAAVAAAANAQAALEMPASDGPGVPLYEINCEVCNLRQASLTTLGLQNFNPLCIVKAVCIDPEPICLAHL